MKVYFDGKLQEEDDAMLDWRKTSELTIPAGTQVVAIECQDLGVQEGILASAEGGLLTSSLYWECAAEPLDGWTMPGFVAPQPRDIGQMESGHGESGEIIKRSQTTELAGRTLQRWPSGYGMAERPPLLPAGPTSQPFCVSKLD